MTSSVAVPSPEYGNSCPTCHGGHSPRIIFNFPCPGGRQLPDNTRRRPASAVKPPSSRRQMDAGSGRRLSFTQTRPGRERGSMKITGAVLEEIGRPRPFAESRPISISELELAAPGPTEILVRLEAAGICHSDLSVVDGNRVRPVPMLLGHEAAGIVERVGAAVADLAVGQRVVL